MVFALAVTEVVASSGDCVCGVHSDQEDVVVVLEVDVTEPAVLEVC